MPVSLTKEQVAQLDEDQLEAYARVHLDSERTRRELCDLASGRNRNLWVPAILMVVGSVILFWFSDILSDPFNLIILLFTLLIILHTRTNRRIDAIFTLLELARIPNNGEAEQAAAPDGDPSRF